VHKSIEHRFDLSFARMAPDRSRQKEVERHAEHGCVEIGIEVEPRLFDRALLRREETVEPDFDAAACRLQTVVTAGVQKAHQPIGDAQTAAAEFEELRLRNEAFTK
jgi:hypothetical protein